MLARESIPAGATVAVVVGPPSVLDPGVAAAVPGTMCDWLLPRRCVSEIASADWVITYHVPSESLPVKGREIGLGPDANAVEVAR